MMISMGIDINHFREILESEKKLLLEELARVGRINPENPKDWEPTSSDLNIQSADMDERAEAFEDFGDRSGIEVELEKQLENVNAALERIRLGTYGICIVSGKPIEHERLEANPSATTCIEFRDKE
jgi:RNA polymerase-binding transcription factor DksA